MLCRYFPELNNLSTTVTEAPQFAIRDLADLSGVNTCDRDDPGLDLADGKFGLVSAGGGGNTTGNNCSVAERANIIQVHMPASLFFHVLRLDWIEFYFFVLSRRTRRSG